MNEIRLTKQQEDNLASIGISITEPTVLLPPKRKVIRLRDLPEKSTVDDEYGNRGFIHTGSVYSSIHASGVFEKPWARYGNLKLAKGPKVVWEGDECPVPDGVIVRVGYRGESPGGVGVACNFLWMHRDSSVDIIWYQIIGAQKGWEVVSE